MRERAGAESFGGFAAAQLSALLRPAYYLTGDWDLAEDLVQSTLVRMYGVWGRLKPDVDRVEYARTVLVNLYRDQTRSERRARRAVVRAESRSLSQLLTAALVTVAASPSPSFAPTPGIGTLDIGIRMVGGPYPGVDVPTAAGTITVTQHGKTVAGGTATSGHRLSVHLPVGTYQVRANGCPAVTVEADSASVTQVEARCDIP